MESIRLREGDGVLLVRLGAVGDVVRTLPCLARLRESLPSLRLAWVVEPPSAPLLPGSPWLDQALIFPRGSLAPPRLVLRPAEGLWAFRNFLTCLRAFRPALVIDFQGSLKSSLIGRLSGARVRLGFDQTGAREGSHLLSSVRVRPSSASLNRIDKNLELLAPLGLGNGPLKFPFREDEPSDRVRDFLDSLGSRVRIAVHAGTSRLQDHKQWPAENFARLVSALAGEGWLPILTWGPGEEETIRKIQNQSGGSGVPTPPLDLGEMRQIIAGCDLFVGADTGPMHLAWSQGVPVVALFGATDPRINGPLGDGHRIIAPAWDGMLPPPPRGDRSAIRRVTLEMVFQAAIDVVSSRGKSGAGVPAP